MDAQPSRLVKGMELAARARLRGACPTSERCITMAVRWCITSERPVKARLSVASLSRWWCSAVQCAGIWTWTWEWAWTWGLTRHLRVRLAVISPSGRAWVGVGVGVGVSVSVAVAGWCGWCVLVARSLVAGAWWPGPGGRSRGGRSRGGRSRGGRGLRAGGWWHRADSGWWALICRLGAVGLGCGRGAAGR